MTPNKEQFVELINAIEKIRQKDNDFSFVLSEYLNYYTVIQSHDEFTDKVIAFTESLFGRCGCIHAFVYDMDFGRVKPRTGGYYKDASELYDELTSSK